MESAARVVVVGGGLAGSAAAVKLAAAGHRVTVIDPNEHLGGKMNCWEAGGYHFDMGPTIITMPQSIDRLFASVGRSSRDYLDMVRLDPGWRCFFADGSVIDLYEKVERLQQELARIAPRDAESLPRFMKYSRQMLRISDEYFFWKPYGAISDLFKEYGVLNPAGLKLGSQIHPFTSLHQVVARHFKDPRVVQMFDHFIQYVGSSPFMSPAILTLIAAVQLDLGVWYPMGGTGQIARALEKLAGEFGVTRRNGEIVSEILTEGKRATGVRLFSGDTIPADVVVSNCDIIRTYEELIRDRRGTALLRKERQRYEPACSGVVLYLGCNRTWDHLAHHDFIFSEDAEDEFRDIYDRHLPAKDMTIYLAAPSITDPSVAPKGCTALYALIHTPYRTDRVDWAVEGPRYREAVLDRLEQRGLTGLRESIQVERMLTPVDIERLYRSKGGSIYGILTQKGLTAAFKPGNRCPLFENLYFAGGSANPGAGVPMVIMSGQITANCVLEDCGAPEAVAV